MAAAGRRAATHDTTAITYLVDIHPEGCADVLASSTSGGFGVIVDGHPEILPVNHVYDRETGCVAFPSNPRTKLHTTVNGRWAAFEVDGVEPDDSSGWSVSRR